MTEKRGEKTEICKTLSLVCHIENFRVRYADVFKIGSASSRWCAAQMQLEIRKAFGF
jgi:hypothetical protein